MKGNESQTGLQRFIKGALSTWSMSIMMCGKWFIGQE
jgi:hypothetical protein